MVFRQAVPTELEQVVALRLAFLEEVAGDLGSGRRALSAVLDDYFRRRLGRDLYVFVAEEDGTLAAMAILLLQEKPAHPFFPSGRVGEVLSVYTRPESRRRGAARGTLEALIAFAGGLALDNLSLKATEKGYPLYSLLGFQEEEHPNRPMFLPLRPREKG